MQIFSPTPKATAATKFLTMTNIDANEGEFYYSKDTDNFIETSNMFEDNNFIADDAQIYSVSKITESNY